MSSTRQSVTGSPGEMLSTVQKPPIPSQNLVRGSKTLPAKIPANPAQVMRAAQKDVAMTRFIEQEVAEQIRDILGNIPRRENIIHIVKQFASFLYYGCTTLSGLQTLGEEYSGILMISRNGLIPHKLILLQMILFKCCGSALVSFLIKNGFFQSMLAMFGEHNQAKDVDSLVKDIVACLPVLNSGLFYLTGDYADISKRITRIRYIVIRFWLKWGQSHLGFVILGVMSILYSLVVIVQALRKYNGDPNLDSIDHVLPTASSINSEARCPFCFESRKNPAVTTCGHLFCWKCIMEALQVDKKCPLCRETVEPSRVVLLQNYNE